MAEKNRVAQVRPVSAEDLRELAEHLDQLITLVSQELEFMQVPGETPVTGSMVNNYVKQGVIPAPRRKRYTRRHVASLLFVCALKRVFSIAQASQLAGQIWDSGLDLEALYDDSCAALERALAARFSSDSPGEGDGAAGEKNGAAGGARPLTLVDASGEPAAPELARLIQAAMDALAAKVAVEQALLLGAGGE